jgi:transposase
MFAKAENRKTSRSKKHFANSRKEPVRSKKRFIGKPRGQIQERVQAVGPEHFGIVSVDCAKRRSKWMLVDFYGKVIIEPTVVEHNAGQLRLMTQTVHDACQTHGLADTIVAVEMTGIYHKPVQRAFRKAGFDTRIVHPFASKHFRKPLHPGDKTDDHDLEAIFHAAVNGYGLATLPVGEDYQSLQSLARHRNNLVKQRARLMVQIRRLMHLTMPGFADLFDDNKLFDKSIALPVAWQFSSAAVISQAGVDGLATYLKQAKISWKRTTLERIVAWAGTAPEPSELVAMHTSQWQQLEEVRRMFDVQIANSEREMAGFLAKTPYVLLLSVKGINVVSAARLAGEAGPIEHYATARAINGRAGLHPSRYQSDEVDHADGSLPKQCNRRLRGAAMLVATNLIKCHPHYRGLNALWDQQNVDPRDRHCRIANRAMRMVFQIVGGRQLWRGRGINREYLLDKLRRFHLEHQTPLDQVCKDLHQAFAWLPKSAYADEAQPLVEAAHKKQRGPTSIGELLLPLLLRLGVGLEEKIGGASEESVKSNTSEARSSD